MIGNRRGGRVFGRGGGVRTVPFCLFAVRLRRREGGGGRLVYYSYQLSRLFLRVIVILAAYYLNYRTR